MLDGLDITHVSLHTAEPNESGSNEVSGGAYTREAISFSAAAAGNLDSSNAPVFDVPAGTTITHVGFWTALSAGSCRAWAAITNESFGAAGTYTLNDADLTLT